MLPPKFQTHEMLCDPLAADDSNATAKKIIDKYKQLFPKFDGVEDMQCVSFLCQGLDTPLAECVGKVPSQSDIDPIKSVW